MAASGQETEAKFYVRDLDRVRRRLQELNARLVQERTLETNIRFDLPGSPLRAQGRVLRLRHDTSTKLTYKGPGADDEGTLSREEIEFQVDGFETARRFLEALGYQKLVYYEKYRTTYGCDECLVMLDELPYGSFVEIEGETVPAIRHLAERLHLRWETAIAASYNALFDRARLHLRLALEDLSFDAFRAVDVGEEHLEVRAADA